MKDKTLQSHRQQVHERPTWKFCLLLVACCVVALGPLVPPQRRLWLLWSWGATPGVVLLPLLAIAFVDQLRLIVCQHVRWGSILPSPLLCAVLVLIHDELYVWLNEEIGLVVWLPLLVSNLAFAVKAWLTRHSIGSTISLLVAIYLASIFVRNFVDPYSFEGMFTGGTV